VPAESPLKEVGFVDLGELLEEMIDFFGRAGW
jgi:hypothetical protein